MFQLIAGCILGLLANLLSHEEYITGIKKTELKYLNMRHVFLNERILHRTGLPSTAAQRLRVSFSNPHNPHLYPLGHERVGTTEHEE